MSQPSSPEDDGKKFYEELLNKYQLFKIRNNNQNVDNETHHLTSDEDANVSNVFIVEPDEQLLIDELFNDNDLTLNEKLIKLKDCLQEEIRKEIKIRDGSENLRKVSKDTNILQHLNFILKQSNYRLNELKRDLYELNSYIQLNSSQGQQSPSK